MTTADATGMSAATAPSRRAAAVYLVRGALALTFGVAVLLFGTGLSRLCTFVALYVTAAGVLTLHWAVARGRRAGAALALTIGLLWIGTGVAVLAREQLQDAIGEGALLDALGLVAVATGVIRIAGWFHDDPLAGDRPRRRYRYVVGPLDIWLGLAVLVADEHTSTGIRITLGLWGVVTATFLILDGLAARPAHRAR
jgi:uncharacterized membrane protein HdeD (DUF308 family)